MELRTVERPEVLRSQPGESTLFPPVEDASRIRTKFNQILNYGLISLIEAPAQRPSIPSIAEIGRTALVKWQSRDPEKSWQPRSPWIRRVATVLGSTAAITTVSTLVSRSTQAYAMARHGMHFGFEHIPNPMDSIPPPDTDHAAVPPEATKLALEMVSVSQQQVDGVHDHGAHYNIGAKTISPGEGWFSQFREMGIHGNNVQLDNLLDNVGSELHDRGLAYYDHHAHEWRMKLVDPNSSGSGYHHARGSGSFREQDLDYIMDKAADHNLTEHHPGRSSAEHRYPPVEPAPPPKLPEQHPPAPPSKAPTHQDNPDLGHPSADKPGTKEVNWIEASENWVATQWNDMVNVWKHFIELDFKDIPGEAKEAWNGFWRNGNWLKAGVLGFALFAMRKYEHGRRAYEATYPGSTQIRTKLRPISWRNPRTWRHGMDWRAWRHSPVATEDPAATTIPVRHVSHPKGPPHSR